VELTGFEPVAPSLRKMRSKRSDQGKRLSMGVLCATAAPDSGPLSSRLMSQVLGRVFGKGIAT